MNRALSVMLIAALLGTPLAAHAAGAPAKPAAPPPMTEPADAGALPDAVTAHTITIDGHAIPYTARAGTLTLYDQDEHRRPASSTPRIRPRRTRYPPGHVPLQRRPGQFDDVAAHGLVRSRARGGGKRHPDGPPPYRIVDNPRQLLDKSDLVFIDMPDTGFGRILAGQRERFLRRRSGRRRVRAVHLALPHARFDRWNSPKFLFGESYGTTRSAALADYLFDHGIALNGVVLLSSILNFGLDYGNGDPIGGGDWPYVLYLPTEAATAWYHHKVPQRARLICATFLQRRASNSRIGEYLDALYSGDKIGAAERDDVVRKLERLSRHSRSSSFATPTCACRTTAFSASCCARKVRSSAASTARYHHLRSGSRVAAKARLGIRPIRPSTRRTRRRSTSTYADDLKYNPPFRIVRTSTTSSTPTEARGTSRTTAVIRRTSRPIWPTR